MGGAGGTSHGMLPNAVQGIPLHLRTAFRQGSWTPTPAPCPRRAVPNPSAKTWRDDPVSSGVHVVPPSRVRYMMPSLPAIQAVSASMQLSARKGRLVPAS